MRAVLDVERWDKLVVTCIFESAEDNQGSIVSQIGKWTLRSIDLP